MTSNSSSSRFTKTLWWIIIIILAMSGVFFLLVAILPFPTVKSLANLLSKDGNLQSFTPARYHQLKYPFLLVGVLLDFLAIAWGFARKTSSSLLSKFIHWLSFELKATGEDIRQFNRALRKLQADKIYLIVLLGLILLASVVRAEQLNGPIYHDEAFTFTEYASHSFATVMTDYSLPNNHVFHTVLVRVAYLLFGNYPWILRLPAFLAGVLVIPAMYLVGRMLYNKKVALLATAAGVFMPQMIGYASSARGYSLVTLFSLLIFGLGIYLSRHKNRAAWLLLAVCAALGFYTIPTMLYPIGILFTWFLLTAFTQPTQKVYDSTIDFLKYAVVAGVVTVLLAMLFYSPIFAVSGFAAVFSNHVIQSNSIGEFLKNLPVTLGQIWDAWLTGLPWLGMLVIIGCGLSLVFHWKISSARIPMQLAAVLFPAIALLVQRPDSTPRVWSFLLPFLLIWTAAGLLAPFELIQEKLPGHPDLAAGIMAAGIVLAVVLTAKSIVHYLPQFEHPHTQTEDVAVYLKSQVKTGNVIAVTYPYDMSVIYYLYYHGVPKIYTKDIATQNYTGLYVVIYPDSQQTIDTVLYATGIDSKKIDTTDCKFRANVGDAFIFYCLPIH